MVFWAINYWGKLKRPQIYLPLKYLSKESSFFGRIPLFFVGLLGWCLISFSMIQPRTPLGHSYHEIEVNDIFFVVDVSRSMLANDFRPNRLEAAKSKIKQFVALRPKDRIGIIIFAERVFTLLPLSTDLKLVKNIVDEIKIGFLGNGTNIGDALGLGIGRAIQSVAKNKIIILLTDGVSNVGNITPLEATKHAVSNRIKIYTIGIGGDKRAQIPVLSRGKSRLFQNIPGGSIDTKTLREIALSTGAKFFLAKNSNALQGILEEIGRLEKTKISSYGKIIYKELFYPYLFMGVVLLLGTEIFRKGFLKEIE